MALRLTSAGSARPWRYAFPQGCSGRWSSESSPPWRPGDSSAPPLKKSRWPWWSHDWGSGARRTGGLSPLGDTDTERHISGGQVVDRAFETKPKCSGFDPLAATSTCMHPLAPSCSEINWKIIQLLNSKYHQPKLWLFTNTQLIGTLQYVALMQNSWPSGVAAELSTYKHIQECWWSGRTGSRLPVGWRPAASHGTSSSELQ